MITRYRHKNLVWIDLEKPTQEEVRLIMEEFSINPLVAEELLTPTLKPKVDFYQDYIYLILHFPAFKHTHLSEQTNQEVDFIIGKHFLIITRYDTIDPLHKFSKVFEVNSILDRSNMGDHAGYLFFYMIKKLYKALDHELDSLRDGLNLIESGIFEGNEKDMVVEISKVSRDLLNFKQATSPHQDVLDSFEEAGKQFFGPGFIYHLKSVTGEYFRIHHEIHELSDSIIELRETNNSLLSTKQNEVMKTLTIMAFVTFPLSLIASIFGMNTENIPFVGRNYDFWIVIGLMGLLTLSFFIYFKKNKWL